MGHDTFRRRAALPRAACRDLAERIHGTLLRNPIQLNSSFGTPEGSLSLGVRNAFSTAIERGQE